MNANKPQRMIHLFNEPPGNRGKWWWYASEKACLWYIVGAIKRCTCKLPGVCIPINSNKLYVYKPLVPCIDTITPETHKLGALHSAASPRGAQSAFSLSFVRAYASSFSIAAAGARRSLARAYFEYPGRVISYIIPHYVWFPWFEFTFWPTLLFFTRSLQGTMRL